MNKIRFFLAAFATAVLASCSTVEREEPGIEVPEGFKVLTVDAGRTLTKTSYAGEVIFSWSEGDRISVLCNNGSADSWQTFTADGPGAVSTFTAVVPDNTVIGALDGTKAALYPADEGHVYTDENTISFHLPAERDFRAGENTHKESGIPMFAWGDDDDCFAFANLTGAVRFTFCNIPSEVTQVKMVFENTTHLKLNGLYTLALDDDAAKVFWPAASSEEASENSVTYYADVENGVARFYLPYAAGSLWAWNHLTLSDASTDAALYSNTKVGQINVTQNRIVVLPSLDVATGTVEAGYTSAYGIDWSTVPASANAGSDYLAIKSMKATADEDYLYVYLEVNPDVLTRTHQYDHYIKVMAATSDGSNSWWSTPSKVEKIGNSSWAVHDGNIAFLDFGTNPAEGNVLAASATWYYEIRMSRATNAAITDPGKVNIGVVLDDTFYQNTYGHTQGDVPVGVIPASGTDMYPVTLPGGGGQPAFSYDSAYNLDWSAVEAAVNTNASYPVLKSLRAQGTRDYLYLLLEADPSQMALNHGYSHQLILYAGDWNTKFGVDSWLTVKGSAAYKNWATGYSDCETNTTDNASWFYEIRLSRTHSSTGAALGNAGTVQIGVAADNYYVDNNVWSSGGQTVGILPSGGALYPVTFPGAPAGGLNFNQNYTELSDGIANPERGFYKFVEYKFNGGSGHPSATYSLNDQYDSENTLVLALFYLNDFVDGETISENAKTYIRTALTNVRTSGKKAIVRFGYSNTHQTDPTKHPQTIHQEPTKDQILSHIAQIKPILQDYEDVILVGQAGFIGTYGEWYYTTNFSKYEEKWNSKNNRYEWYEYRDFTFDEDNDKVTGFTDRYTVLTAILDAFPTSRQVEVRTPAYKQFYINPDHVSQWTSLNDNNGFGTDPVNRLAFHNDAFLYGGTDLGTFHYDFEKAMWQQQAEYLICGGEAPYSSTPITEMEGYSYNKIPAGVYNNHYTYLHHDTAYPSGSSGGSTLFRHWYEEGWIPNIKKMLGYRLYLSHVSFSASGSTTGSTAHLSFTLKNSGAARVVNERPMKLVLLHNGTPYILSEDIGNVRLVPSGKVLSGTTVTPGSKEFEVDVTLNRNIVSGDQLAIWLPDKAEGLQDRSVYSIRLANEETTWTSGGYNVIYTFNGE